MPEPIEVRKVPLHNVSDASELAKLIDDGVLEADRVIAVIGKTEGNGGVNDYTRILADRAFRDVLTARGTRTAQQVKQIPIVWSGGTDGVISPHATIFATLPADQATATDEPRLTVGFAMSERLLPEDIGRTAMILKVADAVREAMERAGITDPADVHYVQTKTPLLTIGTISDAKSRGQSVWTENTHESMDLSNGCTALGIAVALGEIVMPSDADVLHNRGCTRPSPRVRPESSSTGPRSSSRATRAGSAAGTGSGTRSCGTRLTPTGSGARSATPVLSCLSGRAPRTSTGGW